RAWAGDHPDRSGPDRRASRAADTHHSHRDWRGAGPVRRHAGRALGAHAGNRHGCRHDHHPSRHAHVDRR
ncbi:MAG TPA: hypothetical protein VFY89_09545, partial [Ktedonobacterales bacterium]